jgi:ribose transport system ATP-binding protein
VTEPALALHDVGKAYPGVQALDGVSFDVRPGEVHALMGENGAGKSTLMKIAGGVVRPDAGTVEVAGRPVQLTSPRDAARAGIQVVFQELTVLDNLDVAHNLLVGDLPVRRGAVDRKALYARAAAVLADLGIDLDPRARAELLGVGRKQLLEIARAVAQRPRVLVLDEPTSSLGRKEEEVLFTLVERLRADGVGVAYISHRMGEVLALADRVTVLRDGRRVITADAGTVSRGDLIRSMVGRELVTSTRVAATPGPAVLVGRGLVRAPLVAGVDLELRAGEVLGLAGLLGSGRSETARLLAGVDRPAAGGMTLDGRPFSPPTVRAAVRAGVCYLPEDRKLAGLVLGMSIQDNIALPQLRRLRRHGLLSRRAIAERAAHWVSRLSIRTPRHDASRGRAQRGQPAEGGAGEVAGHRPPRGPAGRADARRRRGRQGRDRRTDPGSRSGGCRCAGDQLRAARGAVGQRPDRGDGVRPHRRHRAGGRRHRGEPARAGLRRGR